MLIKHFLAVLGTTGHIGGTISHEFHFPAAIGEDKLLICACGYAGNVELSDSKHCPECGGTNFDIKHGIEVNTLFFCIVPFIFIVSGRPHVLFR